MANSISKEELLKLMAGQAKAADGWIQQFEKYKDVSSIRQVSLAIGKYAGMYNVLLSMYREENLPEEVIAEAQRLVAIWDRTSEPAFQRVP